MTEPAAERHVTELARRARAASRDLALAHRADKDAALHAMADALEQRAVDVLAANADDVRRAEESGIEPPMIDRLRLTAGASDRDGRRAA